MAKRSMKWNNGQGGPKMGYESTHRGNEIRQYSFPRSESIAQSEVPRSTAAETRVAGATLAPSVQPGLPQMVMMPVTHNNTPAKDRGGRRNQAEREGGSRHCGYKGNSECQTGKLQKMFLGFALTHAELSPLLRGSKTKFSGCLTILME